MKIIIIEDDEDLLVTLTDLLESEGHDVIGCMKAKGVVDKIAKEHPDYALVDIKLPDGLGHELADSIRKAPNTNGVKIYLMSASEELVRLTRESGADGYIRKPFTFKEVLDVIS